MPQQHEQLAVIISERRAFGHVMAPYMINTERAPSLQVLDMVTPAAPGYASLAPHEQKVVAILSDITEQALCKRFGKRKTVKEFNEKTDADTIEKMIRPFIDTTICKALPLIVDNEIPVYYKDAGYTSIYEADRVHVAHCRPKFYFTIKENNELSYTLKIADGREETTLLGKKIAELSADPAILLVNNRIYAFQNIDARKFRPFTSKQRITVPERSVATYMNSFVRNCITNHYVQAYGFRIVKSDIHCRPHLKAEQSIEGYNLYLQFAYGERMYDYNTLTKTVELTTDGGQYIFRTCQRQSAREHEVMQLLCDNGLYNTRDNALSPDETGNHTTITPLVEWINANSAWLENNSISVSISHHVKYYSGPVSLNVQMNEDADWFDIYATVVLNGYEMPFLRLRRNIINNIPEYELPNGEIFIIPQEWFATWSDILAFATASGDALRLDKMHSTLLPDYLAGNAQLAEQPTILKRSTTPRRGNLNAQLRPYQAEGFEWMNTLYENNMGGILADDMGLGKTLQTIAMLSHAYCTDNADTLFNTSGKPASLIILPVSLLHNWTNELARFAPHLSIYNYSGKNRLKTHEISRIFNHYHVVLTSYGLIRNDTQFLSSYRFHYIIIDESQYIKNPASKTYRAIQELSSDHKLTISGTPIENRLSDLWAQMNIVNPGLLGSSSFFRNYFESAIVRGHNEEREAKLKQLIAPFILRRTKEMVASDLPPITYQTILCPMTTEQKVMYDREKSAFRNGMFLNDAKRTFVALQALTRLRLLANHPTMLDKEFDGQSGKFLQVMEHIESIAAEGHKMLVFSSFVTDLKLIANELDRRGIGHSMLIGATAKREDAINEFVTDERKSVFLISLKAGGVGLNLTSAEYVFVLNPWWNPAAEAQAINRAHRIGQTKSVFVYRFITQDSIEEKISKLQRQKQELADSFIQSNNPIADLTPEEINELLFD